MRRVDLHGLVALVLAVGIVAAIIILALETVLHSGPVSESEAAVISTIIGAIIGALSAYLGLRAGTNTNGTTGGDTTGTPDSKGTDTP